MSRRRTVAALSAGIAFATLLSTAPAVAAPEPAPDADYCAGQCHDVLPPGQSGNATLADLAGHMLLGTMPPHSDDQLDRYAGLAHGYRQLNTATINEFFTDIPSQPASKLESQASKYYGGEERISHGSGNSLVIAFPGSSSPTGSSYKPEAAVLASILGGPSSIKWSAGSSKLLQATQNAPNLKIQTKSDIFSDAGLLSVTLSGSADDVASNAKSVVETLKAIASGVSSEDLAKAKALAKFKELEYGQSTQAAIELTGAGLVQGGKAYQIDEVGKAVDTVTAEKVQQLAKEALENRASVSAVGDLYVLPYAEEIGLRV